MRQRKIIFIIAIIGMLLRLYFALTATLDYEQLGGGDIKWYLANGLALFSGEVSGVSLGMPFDISVLPTAPLYLIFVGIFLKIFPFEVALILIRLVQVAMGMATCYFGYDIAKRITDDDRAGLVAFSILVLSPAFILEPAELLTESSYIFYVVGGLWAYIRAMKESVNWRWLALSGVFFALATLTRAVSMLYPLGLAGLILLALVRNNWRQAFLAAIFFFGIYASLEGAWTIYNALAHDRFVIGSSQLMPAIWRGTSIDNGTTPSEIDEILGDDTYAEQAAEVIAADPTAYTKRRITELTHSYLQPHGTIALGGDSLKVMATDWVKSGFSPAGFWQLINGEGFFPKLLIYIWHFAGLLLGILGMIISLKRWQVSLSLTGFVVYTTLLHLVIFALPRYIFPAIIIYWIFSAIALIWLWDKVSSKYVIPKTINTKDERLEE